MPDTNFCFVTPPPPPADLGGCIYCDEDNNGIFGGTDTGIGGVTTNLICAGPDGMLGTADDMSVMQVTGADGTYIFIDLAPGLCRVTVGQSSAPSGKVLGQCGDSHDRTVPSGGSAPDANFCFFSLRLL